MIEAKVIEDSISEYGNRITTLQIRFQRFILPEFLTHRVFSRNFSSSRAIPTAKLIEQVRNDPAMPVHWGKNQPGMQAHAELESFDKEAAIATWLDSARLAADQAEAMAKTGIHKQIVNRVLEPYMWVTGIVTSTYWDNWNSLRIHDDAQPEIHVLAKEMKDAIDNSVPAKLCSTEWHLPYVTMEERSKIDISLLIKISAARCCRVSYLKHDGSAPNIDEDLKLFDRLAGSEPKHYSPLEHQATPDMEYMNVWLNSNLHGNFNGWSQFRKMDESGLV